MKTTEKKLRREWAAREARLRQCVEKFTDMTPDKQKTARPPRRVNVLPRRKP